jgi:hypothetical protein
MRAEKIEKKVPLAKKPSRSSMTGAVGGKFDALPGQGRTN